jgi:urea transport system permease protein
MRRGSLGIVLTIAVWIALAALPAVADDWQLSQLTQFLSYGIFAMSLAFVWGQTGLLCFGQAVFFGIGGYVMAVVTKGMLPFIPDGTAIGLLAAMALAAAAAMIMGLLLFRGQGLAGAYFAIVTLSAAVIAELLAGHWSFIGGFNGLLNVPPLRIGLGGVPMELLDSRPVYYVLLGASLLVYAVLLWLERMPLGTVLRAVRDNDRRTAYFGYDIGLYKTFSFALGGAVAGLAGALFVTQFGFVSPALIGVGLSTEVLIWTAVGGREVLLAAYLGALGVRWVESELSEALGQYWLLALGLLFVVAVVIAPGGLLGAMLQLPLPARMLRSRPAPYAPSANSAAPSDPQRAGTAPTRR